jgi:hypothetical protein
MDKTQFTFIFFLLFMSSLLYGQGPLDSLKQGLQQSENINERIQYLYKICGLYNGKNYLNDDSLRLYSSMILEVGNEESHIRELLIAHTFQAYSYFHSDTSKYFKWLSKGETLALKSGNFRQAAISCYNQAKRYENFREFDNVIKASNNGIQHLNQKGKVDTITNADESLYGRFYKKMTSAYTAKSEYDNALLWSSRLKNKAQKTSNKLLKIESYSNSIGIYLKIKEDISFGSKLKSNFEIDSLLKLTIDSMVHESKTMDNVNIVARFVRANIHLGNYFLEKNDIPKAVQSFTMVKQLATEEKFAQT